MDHLCTFCYQVGSNLHMAHPPSLESLNRILGNFSYAELTQESVSLYLFEECNQNLSMSHKELLLWNNCLGHANMKLIQGLFQKNILQTKYQGSKSCCAPLCVADSLSKVRHQGSDCVTKLPCPEKSMASKHDL